MAMTCTHAALKRREFLQLGFKYDNLLMEESAQILEIETFIPMLLQVRQNLTCCPHIMSPTLILPPSVVFPLHGLDLHTLVESLPMPRRLNGVGPLGSSVGQAALQRLDLLMSELLKLVLAKAL